MHLVHAASSALTLLGMGALKKCEATPGMNVYLACHRVLTWAQGMMGRDYLVGDQLVGKDVLSTAAPQVRLSNDIPAGLTCSSKP